MMKIFNGKFMAIALVLTLALSLLAGFAPVVTDGGDFGGLLVEAQATGFDDLLDGITVDGGDLEVGSVGSGDTDFNGILGRYKNIVVAITGFLTVTMFAMMIFMFTKLGVAGDNEMARRKAIGGILTTGIATALLGGATIVIGFFYGAITGTGSGSGGTTPPAGT